MKQFVLADNLDTLIGMRLSGVDGKLVTEKDDFTKIFNDLVTNDSIALMLISPKLIEKNQDLINEVHFNQSTPLITAVLGPNEWQEKNNQIADTIQSAIGIQL
ncbi:V-type ATP synthase subunit F [Aerococcus kribbianus]|uniref:V-type ATP synthase subunit F n=1 Tax=Aerococcus kribbianus TaxID=2999064 RepID=A0A9X3FNY8_9LACT|nr:MULTISPECIES: V-type ATP synthase subunit F [unclassified Aerococcus]MCZ0717028.1 V-type ATP synthase subunit F [Aerococcus sp. YH-aer221]MCZ0725316.1 V-type ATP synthase subunit F [Aerococcus sp. YH-aer222]